jgi:hypothetical protein
LKGWGEVMQVLATTLNPGVSITLTSDRSGWRFASWSDTGDRPLPPPLRGGDLVFATSDDALRYFRSICPAVEDAPRR